MTRPPFLLLLPLLLAACVSLEEPAPAPDNYVLRPHDGGGAEGASPSGVVVERPQVAPGLGSDRIAVLRDGRHLDHLADARWATPLPEMLQAFFHGALERRYPHLEAEVAPTGVGSLRLEATVWDFQAEYEGGADRPPRLHLAMTLRLRRADSNRTLGRVRVARTARAEANRRTAVVAGLEQLLREAFDQAVIALLAEWREKTGEPGVVGRG